MDYDFTPLVNIGIQVLGFVIGLGLVFLFKYARQLLISQVGEVEYKRITGIVDYVVRFLEQQGTLMKWGPEQKKEMAMVLIREACEKGNIQITDDQIDMFIEAAVQVLNTEAGKFEKLPELTEA